MARRFGSTPFAEILPQNLAQDATISAASEALDGILQASALALPDLLIYARLAESPTTSLLPPLERLANLAGGLSPVPEPLLDLLAWQFHVDGYEAAVSYQDKRRLVDRSILMHRRKGTPWAVAEALRSIGYEDARIFEGGGICVHNGEINFDGQNTYAAGNRWALFDIEVDLGDGMGVSKESVARMRVAVEAWKNARSHLRAVRWKASVRDALDIEELLALLAVKPHFRDIRPWGFPTYDGSINYDNGVFRRFDGRLHYDAKHPHDFWEPGGHSHNCLLDPLVMGGTMRLASLVRPCLNYDAFSLHNGSAIYGDANSPALEASLITVQPRPQVEIVEVSESSTTSVRPDYLDRQFVCYNGLQTYGPSAYNGAFNYDAVNKYDSGVFLLHNGSHSYNGSRHYDRWLRNGLLYNGAHGKISISGNLGLSDSVRHSPDHSGFLRHEGNAIHGAIDKPGLDLCKASVASRLVDEARPEEKGDAVIAAHLADELARFRFDGSISYGQRRIHVHDGAFRHDGVFPSGCFGGNPDFHPARYDGFGRHDASLVHERNGWLSGNHSPIWFYRNLSDTCQTDVSVEFADKAQVSLRDEVATAIAPLLSDNLKPSEKIKARIGSDAADWIGHNHDGSITYGQKQTGIHSGSRIHDGSLVSGPYGGMSDFQSKRHDGRVRFDGASSHKLWQNPLYSYRTLSDFTASKVGAAMTDSFSLKDEFSISVIRHAFHNGKTTHNASKPYCGKELV